jgi:hypothetical protein
MMKKIMLSIAIVVLSLFCFTVTRVKANSYRIIDNAPYNAYDMMWEIYPVANSMIEINGQLSVTNDGHDILVYMPVGLDGFHLFMYNNYDLVFYNGYEESDMEINYYEDGHIHVGQETISLFENIETKKSGFIHSWGLPTNSYDYIECTISIQVEVQSGTVYEKIAEMYADNFSVQKIYDYLIFTDWNAIVVPLMENSGLTESELIDSYNSGYESGVIEGTSYLQSLIDDAYTDGYGDALNESITTSWFLNMMNGVAAIFNIEVFDGVKLSFFIFFPLVIGLIGRFFWLRRGGGNG